MLQTASEQVLHQETRTVDSERLLYVNQREFAATLPSDGIYYPQNVQGKHAFVASYCRLENYSRRR